MKKTLYVTAALLLLVGLSTAVVGGPEPGDGEAAITSAPDQNWQAEVELANATCMSDEEEGITDYGVYTTDIEDQDEALTGVHFTGFIQTPNPCYTVDYEVTEEGDNVYTMNIVTEEDLEEGEVCMQCVGVVEYEANFETDDGFQLNIEHDGEEVETIEHEYVESSTGLFSSFINWLRGLF